MAAAWLILVAYATHLFSALPGRRAIRVMASALWLVLVDLVLDPVASGPLGFWRWEQPGAYFGVPTANFAGWFLVGLVAVRIVPEDGGASPWVLGTGLAVVGFFTVIAASLGLLFPGGVGLLLCVLHVAGGRGLERSGVARDGPADTRGHRPVHGCRGLQRTHRALRAQGAAHVQQQLLRRDALSAACQTRRRRSSLRERAVSG
jgi:hypothetical protein